MVREGFLYLPQVLYNSYLIANLSEFVSVVKNLMFTLKELKLAPKSYLLPTCSYLFSKLWVFVRVGADYKGMITKNDYDYDYSQRKLITIMIIITCSNEMFFKQLSRVL